MISCYSLSHNVMHTQFPPFLQGLTRQLKTHNPTTADSPSTAEESEEWKEKNRVRSLSFNLVSLNIVVIFSIFKYLLRQNQKYYIRWGIGMFHPWYYGGLSGAVPPSTIIAHYSHFTQMTWISHSWVVKNKYELRFIAFWDLLNLIVNFPPSCSIGVTSDPTISAKEWLRGGVKWSN